LLVFVLFDIVPGSPFEMSHHPPAPTLSGKSVVVQESSERAIITRVLGLKGQLGFAAYCVHCPEKLVHTWRAPFSSGLSIRH
jgi:hypothetical protein